MVEFDSHLNIEINTKTDDSHYITKDISIDNNLKLETPMKIFNVSKVNLKDYKDDINKNLIETTKYINTKKSFDSLYNNLERPENNQKSSLNQFFKVNNLFKSFNSTISLSFSRNPFQENKFEKGKSEKISYSSFEYLLDYIHEYSTTFLLVPDINFETFKTFEDYLKYIFNAVNTFSTLNSKPIFVPISMKLNNKNLDKLLDFYHSNKFSNFWFNFNSTQINTKIALIRYALRAIEKRFNGSSVVYFSNMKKEINRNINDIRTKPSDALSPFLGCDLLGANREYGFGGRNLLFEKEKNKLNQNRIFDPNTYYYFNINKYPNNLFDEEKILNMKGHSDILNSIILKKELDSTRKFVNENNSLTKYLKNKEMFTNENSLKNDILFREEGQSSILNFIKNY